MLDSLLKWSDVVCVVCGEEFKHELFLEFRNRISLFDLRHKYLFPHNLKMQGIFICPDCFLSVSLSYKTDFIASLFSFSWPLLSIVGLQLFLILTKRAKNKNKYFTWLVRALWYLGSRPAKRVSHLNSNNIHVCHNINLGLL